MSTYIRPRRRILAILRAALIYALLIISGGYRAGTADLERLRIVHAAE